MTKIYRILRSTPTDKEGTFYKKFFQPGGHDYYMPVNSLDDTRSTEGRIYLAETVEGMPQWFSEIKEPETPIGKFEWTDELVLAFARFTNSESNTFQSRYADLEEFKQPKSTQPVEEQMKTFFELTGQPTSVLLQNNLPVEETKDKDWGIASFYDGCVNGHTDSRCLVENKGVWTNEKIISLGFTIHSVRRLSDGELFTVGDEVEYREHGFNSWEDVCGYGKIKIMGTTHSGAELLIEIDDNYRWQDSCYPKKFLANIRHKPSTTPPK